MKSDEGKVDSKMIANKLKPWITDDHIQIEKKGVDSYEIRNHLQFTAMSNHDDAIFIEELRRHELYDRVSQAFAVFLPVRSVAVMGDGRKYDWVIALRAVDTIDFMTAQWSRLPYDFLDIVSRRIVNEVGGVSRVVYDVSGKPPATIEWE